MEEHHPQIRFDWPQILNGEQEAAPPAERPPRRPDRPERPERPDRPPVGVQLHEAEEGAPAPAEALLRPVDAVLPLEAVPGEGPISPAHARLGSEGLARLRARFADVTANINRRVQGDERRRELLEQAEKLNPDTWVTDSEVVQGLEGYEGVLASLRDVIGRRRRRRRRAGGGPAPSPGSMEAASPDAGSAPADDGVDEPADGPGAED